MAVDDDTAQFEGWDWVPMALGLPPMPMMLTDG
jgi:hypothetical protein